MGGIRRATAIAAVAAAASMAMSTAVIADGTETLGTPSVPIAAGSGVAMGGIGLALSQPGVIDVDVPAGASVEQVLLYWAGMSSTPAGADDDIVIEGTTVDGTLIGGPTFFFTNPNGDHYSSTYRADVTALGLVNAGSNSLTVGGLEFDQVNDGAGILVVYDTGSSATIGLVDGNDVAFQNFAPPLDTTVAQTFGFAAEAGDRVADLGMFVSSVEGQVVPGDRPSTIVVTTNGPAGTSTAFANLLVSGDGFEWDTVRLSVTIPAGATELTVQAFSDDRAATGNRPASFTWSAAALSVPTTPPPPPPPPGGGEGCTPGYWKQPHHFFAWTGYAPSDHFETVFGVDASFTAVTLLEAVKQGGGGEIALGRHAVAALLNATSTEVDYLYSAAEVIELVQEAYATGSFETIKDQLEEQNELGCSIPKPPKPLNVRNPGRR